MIIMQTEVAGKEQGPREKLCNCIFQALGGLPGGKWWELCQFLCASSHYSMWHGEGGRKAEDEVGHVTELGMRGQWY